MSATLKRRQPRVQTAVGAPRGESHSSCKRDQQGGGGQATPVVSRSPSHRTTWGAVIDAFGVGDAALLACFDVLRRVDGRKYVGGWTHDDPVDLDLPDLSSESIAAGRGLILVVGRDHIEDYNDAQHREAMRDGDAICPPRRKV